MRNNLSQALFYIIQFDYSVRLLYSYFVVYINKTKKQYVIYFVDRLCIGTNKRQFVGSFFMQLFLNFLNYNISTKNLQRLLKNAWWCSWSIWFFLIRRISTTHDILIRTCQNGECVPFCHKKEQKMDYDFDFISDKIPNNLSNLTKPSLTSSIFFMIMS